MIDLADILLLLGLLLTIALSAFFSGIETGLISLNRITLRQKEEDGNKHALILSRLLRRPERLLATVLVGNNVVNVTITMLFLIWTARLWGFRRAEFLAPLILTPVILIFGEILPKATFRHNADKILPPFAPLLRAVVLVLSPSVEIIMRLAKKVAAALGYAENHSPFVSRDDVRLMFAEGEEKGIIEEEERELIHGVIDFGTTMVREVMVPRIDMIAVRDDTPLEEICEVLEKHGHSRLPVYHEKVDEIVGLVYMFDIMRAENRAKENSIGQFVRPIAFTPESKRIHDLLHEFREKQMFMAVVVDEYGGTAGLVTLEDLIEEIFGEIHDEYDVQHLPVIDAGESLFVLDARMRKDEAEELLGTKFPRGEYETVAGFVLKKLGRIPRKGESFQHDNFQVTILEATERTVTRVKFKLNPIRGNGSSKKQK